MNETACPVCGKLFYPSAEHIYKVTVNKQIIKLCSWTCYRAAQKED